MKNANRLQEMLGSKYVVLYDDCESCVTRVFYVCKDGSRILTSEILNDDLTSDINVYDFELSFEQRMMLIACGNL